MYDPKSLVADEFIDHQEILDTLAYADANKDNKELIEALLEKARPRWTNGQLNCTGLSHREASVLLACEDPELNKKCLRWPKKSKKPSTATASCSSRRFIFPITASTAAYTAPITASTKTSPGKS